MYIIIVFNPVVEDSLVVQDLRQELVMENLDYPDDGGRPIERHDDKNSDMVGHMVHHRRPEHARQVQPMAHI